jgi:hypothetical protein
MEYDYTYLNHNLLVSQKKAVTKGVIIKGVYYQLEKERERKPERAIGLEKPSLATMACLKLKKTCEETFFTRLLTLSTYLILRLKFTFPNLELTSKSSFHAKYSIKLSQLRSLCKISIHLHIQEKFNDIF